MLLCYDYDKTGEENRGSGRESQAPAYARP